MEKEMNNKIEPEEIAFVSFTKKAANEAMTRVINKFLLLKEDFPYIRTLHSLAYRILGTYKEEMMTLDNYMELGELLGIEFSSPADFQDGIPSRSFNGDRYAYIDGYARAKQITAEEAWQQLGDYDVIWEEYNRYQKTVKAYKNQKGLLDFSDLLNKGFDPLPVKVAIIDEAQDLSTLQWCFVNAVFAGAERIYIAGDDDQAIYAWSGADVKHFLSLEGEKIILNQSHRIPRSIHKLALGISNQITNRIEKIYEPTDREGRVEYISNLDSVDFSEGTWLLLARNRYMLKQLAHVLRLQGYLYAFRGDSVINKNHLKAITFWERWRKGGTLTVEENAHVSNYLPAGIEEWPNEIWHKALIGISDNDREFYISLLRRGEKITQKPRIDINTIHGVKGGEAENVLLMTDTSRKAVEAMFESEESSNAEHRVWYVACTRAKESLYILTPQTKTYYDL